MRYKTSVVVVAKALYSTSVEYLEIVFCFFVFQEIKASPKNTQKPVTGLLVSGQVAKSASKSARKLIGGDVGKKIP